MYVANSDTPKNGIQLYVDGKRYRSLFTASVDTEITFCYLSRQMRLHQGAPFKIGHHSIVSERWLLDNPEYLLQIMQAS